MTVGSNGHTSHGIEHAHGDFAIGDEFCDVRQTSIGGFNVNPVIALTFSVQQYVVSPQIGTVLIRLGEAFGWKVTTTDC